MEKISNVVLGLIAVSFLFLTVMCYSAQAGQITIKQRCMKKWGNDYNMVEYCIDNQQEAVLIFQDKYRKYIPKGDIKNITTKGKIVLSCYSKWSKDGTDWTMVNYCCENQLKAYDRVNKTNKIQMLY